MTGDGINISQFSNKIQDLIKENNIDVNNDKKIDKAEIGKLLAVAQENNAVEDLFTSKGAKMPPRQQLDGIKNLLETIIQIGQAKEQDRAEFDTQIHLVKNILEGLENQYATKEEQIEKAKEQAELVQMLLAKKTEGDDEKYGNRYQSLLDAVQPFVEPDEGEPGAKPGTVRTIAQDIAEEAERTKNDIRDMNMAMMTLVEDICYEIKDGDVVGVAKRCDELKQLTMKAMAISTDAMNMLQSMGVAALQASVNTPTVGNYLQEVSNLASTIDTIKKDSETDIKQFKMFIEEIDKTLNTLIKQIHAEDNEPKEAAEKLKVQFKLMNDFMNGKREDIAGRYDNVLTSFESCVNGDIHNNEELGNRYEEVNHMKHEGVEAFNNYSDVLMNICTHAIHELEANGKYSLEDMKNLSKMFVTQLYDLSLSTEESMTMLEDRAFDFLKAVIEQQDKKTAGLKRPEINGKEIDVTPRKRTIDGQLFSVKPLQVNGQWVVQKTPINLQGHATGSPTFDSVEQHPEIFKE